MNLYFQYQNLSELLLESNRGKQVKIDTRDFTKDDRSYYCNSYYTHKKTGETIHIQWYEDDFDVNVFLIDDIGNSHELFGSETEDDVFDDLQLEGVVGLMYY